MTSNERSGESRTPSRRRFINRLASLTGGILLAPLFARATTTPAAMPAPRAASARKAGHVIVFPGSDAAALAARVAALGYGWTSAADLATAHAACARASGPVAVIGTDAGAATALRFARNHAGVKAVFVMGEHHGDALDDFHALQAPRSYAVQVLGTVDSIDWQGAGRWLDRHMA